MLLNERYALQKSTHFTKNGDSGLDGVHSNWHSVSQRGQSISHFMVPQLVKKCQSTLCILVAWR